MQKLFATLGLGACVTLLVCHARWIDEPWQASLSGFISAAHYGRTLQVWDAHGPLECKLRPTRMSSDAFLEPYDAYLNHPPTPYVIAYPFWKLLGRSEAAARVPSLILLGLSMFWLFRLVELAASRRAAWMALAFYGSLPILFAHGNTVDAPAYSLAFLVPGLWTWLRWRRDPGGHAYWAYFVFALLGGLMDWFGYFLVPAIWMDLLVTRTRGRELLRAGFLAGLPFGVALLAYLAWLFAVADDLDHVRSVLGFLRDTADPTLSARSATALDFASRSARHVLRGLGPAHALAVGAGLVLVAVAAARRTTTLEMRAATTLLVAGILPTIVFFDRSDGHEFWSMVAAPGFAAIAAWAVGRLPLRSPTWIAPALVAAAVGIGTWRGIALHDSYRSPSTRDRALIINRHVERGDVLLRSSTHCADCFYLEALTLPHVSNPDHYDFVMNWLMPARNEVRRVFLLWTSTDTKKSEWLADLPIVDVKVVDLPPLQLLLLELDKQRAFARFD